MAEHFSTTMAEMTAARCAICEHPERVAIERSHANGRSFALIARVLKKIDAYPDWMSARSVATRVRIHITEHR